MEEKHAICVFDGLVHQKPWAFTLPLTGDVNQDVLYLAGYTYQQTHHINKQ